MDKSVSNRLSRDVVSSLSDNIYRILHTTKCKRNTFISLLIVLIFNILIQMGVRRAFTWGILTRVMTDHLTINDECK